MGSFISSCPWPTRSCFLNTVCYMQDRSAWRALVHGVTKRRARLNNNVLYCYLKVSEEVCMHTEAHAKNKASWSLRRYWQGFGVLLGLADQRGSLPATRPGRLAFDGLWEFARACFASRPLRVDLGRALVPPVEMHVLTLGPVLQPVAVLLNSDPLSTAGCSERWKAPQGSSSPAPGHAGIAAKHPSSSLPRKMPLPLSPPLRGGAAWHRPFKVPGASVYRRRSAGRHVASSWPAGEWDGHLPGTGGMEAPREDTLQSSWVEVPPLGQEEPPTPACAPHRDMEQILLEAQLEVESPRAEGSFLALKAPGVEDHLSPGQREDAEGSVQLGTLPWSWPSPPEHQKELAGLPPACAPLLSPVLQRRRGLRDPQLLLLVIPPLLLSHVLALGLGICIGKCLAASPASSL